MSFLRSDFQNKFCINEQKILIDFGTICKLNILYYIRLLYYVHKNNITQITYLQ